MVFVSVNNDLAQRQAKVTRIFASQKSQRF